MLNKLLSLADWFAASAWPLLPCPDCSSGMSVDRRNFSDVETFESEVNHDHPDFEADWVHGHFHGVVNCGNSQCGTRVIVIGDFKLGVSDYGQEIEWHGECWSHHYKVRYTHPPILIINRIDGIPDDVWELVRDASRLTWVDPAAALGRLRSAIEALMNNFKIKKLNAKRNPRPLHDRLVDFKKKNTEVADLLLAVKWAGNDGAHGSGATTADVLESAELMEHAFKLLYDKDPLLLRRRATAINKARGLPRTRQSK
ncbi:DUF4145 domain-containing protein [Amycolatopsis rubida]|uniref:DUF4145 domain-containing protein n=1 Tax=Amycolatopsis rubida TaxID=112413 RepID=A0ABX0BSQ0_9PSEU|nr:MULTISPECIES: DUF4145 domain-containing protein [Amycolatopsis]MYW92422.1 DUF4145 domain-containing protein [Amycolatopsis rubida]NEC57410.1 DUF4145 domain-containing protein [Amycolatopsis rubida]OAP29023.1 hypothetical protein A4R44_00817 [Amycolatopsis sp. M39]